MPAVVEVFSPPRVCKACRKSGFREIGSFDLCTGWDARSQVDVWRLWKLLEKHRPAFVCLSPPCGKISIMQNLTPEHKRRDSLKHHREVMQAKAFVNLCTEICISQLQEGRHFVFESARGSKARFQPMMAALRSLPGIYAVSAVGCAFGLRDDRSGRLMSKAWEFVTSSPHVAFEVGRACTRDHDHQPAVCDRALATQVYPPSLVAALLRGMRRQHLSDRHVPPSVSVFAADDDEIDGNDGDENDLGQQRASLDAPLRRLHVNLGHASLPVMLRHLRHANASKAAMARAREFGV